jgi:hypothetical protein
MISPVRGAAQPAAAENESVCGERDEESPNRLQKIPADEPRRQEYRPASPPVHAGWRSLEPHRVAVRDAERGK